MNLPKPNAIIVYKNGDKTFKGIRLSIRFYRTWDSLCEAIAKAIRSVWIVHYLYSIEDGGKKITNLDGLTDGGKYAAACFERFHREIDYEAIATRLKERRSPEVAIRALTERNKDVVCKFRTPVPRLIRINVIVSGEENDGVKSVCLSPKELSNMDVIIKHLNDHIQPRSVFVRRLLTASGVEVDDGHSLVEDETYVAVGILGVRAPSASNPITEKLYQRQIAHDRIPRCYAICVRHIKDDRVEFETPIAASKSATLCDNELMPEEDTEESRAGVAVPGGIGHQPPDPCLTGEGRVADTDLHGHSIETEERSRQKLSRSSSHTDRQRQSASSAGDISKEKVSESHNLDQQLSRVSLQSSRHRSLSIDSNKLSSEKYGGHRGSFSDGLPVDTQNIPPITQMDERHGSSIFQKRDRSWSEGSQEGAKNMPSSHASSGSLERKDVELRLDNDELATRNMSGTYGNKLNLDAINLDVSSESSGLSSESSRKSSNSLTSHGSNSQTGSENSWKHCDDRGRSRRKDTAPVDSGESKPELNVHSAHSSPSSKEAIKEEKSSDTISDDSFAFTGVIDYNLRKHSSESIQNYSFSDAF